LRAAPRRARAAHLNPFVQILVKLLLPLPPQPADFENRPTLSAGSGIGELLLWVQVVLDNLDRFFFPESIGMTTSSAPSLSSDRTTHA
jgi:hypothetical protein